MGGFSRSDVAMLQGGQTLGVGVGGFSRGRRRLCTPPGGHLAEGGQEEDGGDGGEVAAVYQEL